MDIRFRCGPTPRRGAITAALLIGLFWSLPANTSAQTIKVQGKGEQARVIARSDLPLGDMTTGRLESLFRILRSAAPEWDNAQVFTVRFSDPAMRQNRIMRGHMIVIHADGDRTFLDYEFTWKPGGVNTEFEKKARFLRGTGKFTGITGRWIERGVSTMAEDMSEWEIEYSLPGG
jgi:hypothetical protein